MPLPAGELLSSLRRQLQLFPDLLAVFEDCLERLGARDDFGIAVSGSLGHGGMDRYSDLDFEIVALPDTDLDSLKAWVFDQISRIARLLAHFPATHLGLNNLLIFFFETNGGVVKLDAWVMDGGTFAGLPGAIIVRDPGGFLRQSRANRPEPSGNGGPLPDFADLHHKFTGWIWYTYTKIARGECFEAFDSLECMRRYALLPCLHLVEGLPCEGYRRIETRLSPERLASLRLTIPANLQAGELTRSLEAMVQLFGEIEPLVMSKRGKNHRLADLKRMAQIIGRKLSHREHRGH